MKFSKLCLVPLLALGLVACNSVDPSTTTLAPTVTDTAPEAPSWTKEDADKIKAALGGNLIPLLEFENGALTIEEIPEAQGGGQVVVYTINNPKEGDRVALVDKFVADGYVIETPDEGLPLGALPTGGQEASGVEVFAYKELAKKHLFEALGLHVTEDEASNGIKFIRAEVTYQCDEETNVWPAEKLEELYADNLIKGEVPAPEFEFTHVSLLAGEEGEGVIALALYFGDHSQEYAHTLAKSGFEVTIEAEEVETETTPTAAKEAVQYEYIYHGHDDFFATDVYAYYDGKLDATILEIGMGFRQEWYPKAFAKLAEVIGIKGFTLPKPYMEFITYEFGLSPLGEGPDAPKAFTIMGLTLDKNGPSLYLDQLLDAGYDLYDIVDGEEGEAPTIVLMNLQSLALVEVTMEPIKGLGIMVILMATPLPDYQLDAELTTEFNAAAKTATGVDNALPVLGGTYRYHETAVSTAEESITDRYGNEAAYIDLYCYPAEETNALIAASLLSAGYVKEETDLYLGFYNAQTQVFVEIANYTLQPTLTRVIVSKKIVTSTWEQAIARIDGIDGTYADFTKLVGEANLEQFPYPTDLLDATKYTGAEIGADYAMFMYVGNYLEDPNLKTYTDQLVAKGWALSETPDTNFDPTHPIPMYTKTIGEVNYGISVGAIDMGEIIITCVGIYQL